MHELFDIQGKKAIVTGGTRGLGYGMAEALAEAGCSVVIIGSSDRVFETAEQFRVRGFDCHAVKADLGIREENYRVFEESVELLDGDLDILVTAAGIQHRSIAEEYPVEAWDALLSVNLSSIFILCQEAGKLMLKKGFGKIINVASMCSFRGGTLMSGYSATKGGVMQLTKALSNEWAGRGVNVNAIAPGCMATDMNAVEVDNKEGFEETAARIPFGRWGTPDDMKGATIFLASRASDYVSGAIIPVDGGYLVN